jgi:predicted enzyme related to lactoylglutathione lyase
MEFKGVDRKPYTPRIPDPGAPAIGLQVRDIDPAIAAVKAGGGSSITPGGYSKLGIGKVGFVRDPSGILVELAQP